jgi:hypothetical protein
VDPKQHPGKQANMGKKINIQEEKEKHPTQRTSHEGYGGGALLPVQLLFHPRIGPLLPPRDYRAAASGSPLPKDKAASALTLLGRRGSQHWPGSEKKEIRFRERKEGN